MADFSAVLRKTIDGLSDNTPAMRARVYDKARATVESKLAAVSPPPPQAAADRQRNMLEEAITQVEADYAAADAPPPPPVEENEFDRIFAEYDASGAQASDGDPHYPPTPAGDTETAYAPDTHGDRVHEAPYETVGPEHEHPDPLGLDTRRDHDFADEPVGGRDEEPRERWDAAAPRARPRRSRMGLLAALVVLVALVGAAYAVWLNRTEFAALVGMDAPSEVAADGGTVAETAGDDASAETSDDATAGDEGATQTAATPDGDETGQSAPADTGAQEAAADAPAQKFTQRLLPNGEEVDPGPAEDEPELGEGTSVAASTQGGDQQGEALSGDAPAGDDSQSATVPVGQRAIFYEERTNAAQGSAESGSVVWSVVQESPGNDLPPEPAIRAEATIPDKDVQLRMTIRRNADPSLPASHIVELIFLTPDDFEGGGIENVLRVAMKQSEQDTGNPLLGVPAKIADGFFLLALNDTKADLETNRTLLRRQEWIDIPIVYKSGRRALITLEKGVPGDKAFNEALDAWQNGSSG